MASAAEQLAANMNFGAFAKATELHKRLLFTIGALIVYRLGTYIPLPGIDPVQYAHFFQSQENGMLGMFNMFSGGSVQRMAIFALNIMPYISASIIIQLMGSIYSPWEKLKKEGGEAGRKQLNQYTRYLTVVLALAQASAIASSMQANHMAVNPGILFLLSATVTLTGGTLFLMWLGEQITSRGVGNGSSMIIFTGIVAVLPATVGGLFERARNGDLALPILFIIVATMIAAVAFIVFMERAQRRLLVQYPKRQVGNRMMGGDSSFMPLKVNTAGVIPPIFASSLLFMPITISNFVGKDPTKLPSFLQWFPSLTQQLQHGQPIFMVLYAALIIFFTFLYTSLVFNPEETAENLRKYGGFLPGIRPGKRTADYLDYVLTRITVVGAGYITIVCLFPEFMSLALNSSSLAFGGTSILIVVSVTMDTVAQIQSHLLAHQYEGLIKKSRLKTRGR